MNKTIFHDPNAENTAGGCWNKIGVWGEGKEKCPLLNQVIHCVNCEIYHEGSQKVFRKTGMEDYRIEWTRLLAEEKPIVKKHNNSVIIFRVANEWLAIPTKYVKEISNVKPVQSIPHNKNRLFLGAVNISGEIELCFSMEKILRINSAAKAIKKIQHFSVKRMLMTQYQGVSYIFVVDEVGESYQFYDQDILELPDMVCESEVSYMIGIINWRQQRVGLIDPELLFTVIERSLR